MTLFLRLSWMELYLYVILMFLSFGRLPFGECSCHQYKVGNCRIPTQVCSIISGTLRVKFKYFTLIISSELGGIDHWPQMIYLFIHFWHKINCSAHHSFGWQFWWCSAGCDGQAVTCPSGRWLCSVRLARCLLGPQGCPGHVSVMVAAWSRFVPRVRSRALGKNRGALDPMKPESHFWWEVLQIHT